MCPDLRIGKALASQQLDERSLGSLVIGGQPMGTVLGVSRPFLVDLRGRTHLVFLVSPVVAQENDIMKSVLPETRLILLIVTNELPKFCSSSPFSPILPTETEPKSML